MERQSARFDAQCDLAALVYREPNDADRLLRRFADALTGRRYRVVGLIQARLAHGGSAVTVLPTGEVIPLFKTPGPSRLCDLAEAAARVGASIEVGADLLVINRFGGLEAQGSGLVDEITRATACDIPVVVAVSEHRFSEWLSFCSGMTVRLACQDGSLQYWWETMIVGERLLTRRFRTSQWPSH